ncbi:hypothetical protein ACFV1C_02080 [Streptomyces sp. NPDC059605]|uniref:hypothetical protein n=1 Tax=unclassified Streptomyces TaxID=2593676 RepID=UPI0036CCF552
MAATYGHAECLPQGFREIHRQEAEFRRPGLRVGDYLQGVLQELLPDVELDGFSGVGEARQVAAVVVGA